MSQPYEVGFRRPPEATKFKKGQSGNPNGRPRGRKSMAHAFRDFMNEKIPVREGGKVRKITKGDALIHQVYARALKGETEVAGFV